MAQAKGAAACLIRSVGTDATASRTKAGARQPEGVDLPAAALAPADADALARLVARGPVRVRLNIESRQRQERAPPAT